MRKLICVVITFALMISLLVFSAAGITLSDGQELGNWNFVYKTLYEIDKHLPETSYGERFTCVMNGEKIIFFDYHIDEEDFNKLKNIFSDDKLISTGDEVSEKSYSWSSGSYFSFNDSSNAYEFRFDEERSEYLSQRMRKLTSLRIYYLPLSYLQDTASYPGTEGMSFLGPAIFYSGYEA